MHTHVTTRGNLNVTEKHVVLTLALLLLVSTRLSAAQGQMPDFEQLVEDQSSAVVNIQTRRAFSTRPAIPDRLPPKLLRRFHNFRGQRPTPKGLGSGVIISTDGYIMTNAHVVDGATEIMVYLNNKQEFTAKLVGADQHTDIAILKVAGRDLPSAKFGNSDDLRVGQWVLAIGAPFGLEQTATQGIVSAVSRSLPTDSYVPFIQSDVALNPGNSGGPLFNLKGEVIGINSQIFSGTGGYMGLSFAIPINLASSIAEKLKMGVAIQRGWLGISIQDMNQTLAKSFGLDSPAGTLISAVVPNSPADQAKLKAGDVIVEFDGKRIGQASDLSPIVASTSVNADANIKILRAGKAKTIKVTVGLLKSDELAFSAPHSDPFGLILSDMNREDHAAMGNKNGVRVDHVEPGKPAAAAGLQPQDIIVAFNHRSIDNLATFAEMTRNSKPGSTVPILVQRRHQVQFLALEVPPHHSG